MTLLTIVRLLAGLCVLWLVVEIGLFIRDQRRRERIERKRLELLCGIRSRPAAK